MTTYIHSETPSLTLPSFAFVSGAKPDGKLRDPLLKKSETSFSNANTYLASTHRFEDMKNSLLVVFWPPFLKSLISPVSIFERLMMW